jgi:transcription-repair coupling factor (superfamily II helicase)
MRQWNAGSSPTPLAGRHGQAPQTAQLQFSTRAAASRPVTNATLAARDTVRPANAAFTHSATQAGKLKPMREMLYVTFSDKLHAASGDPGQGISVGLLMKLVARNARNGAQLTPQGVLKWPLSSAQADTVLAETRTLLTLMETEG